MFAKSDNSKITKTEIEGLINGRPSTSSEDMVASIVRIRRIECVRVEIDRLMSRIDVRSDLRVHRPGRGAVFAIGRVVGLISGHGTGAKKKHLRPFVAR